MRTTWNSYANTRLHFGAGALKSLGTVLKRLGVKRVLLIGDPVLESLGVLQRAREAVSPEMEVAVFSEGKVEPSTAVVVQCAEKSRAFEPDVTVAVGGGSNMDLAKLTCATVASGLDPGALLGFDQVPGPIGTLICVPTTAGTGSESSASAVIENAETGMKAAAISPFIRPEIAIVDPELSMSCPPKLTAESGIDALTHAIEAYLAKDWAHFETPVSGVLAYEGAHPLGDLYAEKAIRLVGQCFLQVMREPHDLGARSGMALAATLAGLAFSNCGVALAHALEYPIGNRYKCAHGAGNGIVLPAVMRYLRPDREERLAEIGEWLGVGRDAGAAIERVEVLRKQAGLPERLRDVGAAEEDLPGLAVGAHALERLMVMVPTKPSEKDLFQMLQACY